MKQMNKKRLPYQHRWRKPAKNSGNNSTNSNHITITERIKLCQKSKNI